MWYANSFTNLYFTCKMFALPQDLYLRSHFEVLWSIHLFKIILLIFEQLSYTSSQIKMCKLYMNMHKFQDLSAPFQTDSLSTFYLLLYLLRITHKIFIFWSMKCYEFVNNASKYFRSISLLIGAGFCNPAPTRPGGKGHKCSLLPQ